jgi:hypothetical protein
LDSGLDTTWVEGVKVDVGFLVEIEFFLDTSDGTNESGLPRSILHTKRSIDGTRAIPLAAPTGESVPRGNIDNTSFMTFPHLW